VATAVLIPVKAFGVAKGRLRGHLTDAERMRLARFTAERVLAAAAPHSAFVACDDDGVAEWAVSRGATVAWGPGLGLNGAIDEATVTIAAAGFDRVTIAHADLPEPTGLASVGHAAVAPRGGRHEHAIVLVPDRHGDGTNVLSRPAGIALPAHYGAASFRRHLTLALETGAPVTVRLDAYLSVDIDTADDLRHPTVARLLPSALVEAAA
jgi:2-phospho-L-lactate guanylyltransferase